MSGLQINGQPTKITTISVGADGLAQGTFTADIEKMLVDLKLKTTSAPAAPVVVVDPAQLALGRTNVQDVLNGQIAIFNGKYKAKGATDYAGYESVKKSQSEDIFKKLQEVLTPAGIDELFRQLPPLATGKYSSDAFGVQLLLTWLTSKKSGSSTSEVDTVRFAQVMTAVGNMTVPNGKTVSDLFILRTGNAQPAAPAAAATKYAVGQMVKLLAVRQGKAGFTNLQIGKNGNNLAIPANAELRDVRIEEIVEASRYPNDIPAGEVGYVVSTQTSTGVWGRVGLIFTQKDLDRSQTYQPAVPAAVSNVAANDFVRKK